MSGFPGVPRVSPSWRQRGGEQVLANPWSQGSRLCHLLGRAGQRDEDHRGVRTTVRARGGE